MNSERRYNMIYKANKFILDNKHKVNPRFRLNFHLMGEYGWINDPNGLIEYNGYYHAFFQYNPYDSVWGNIHWGHAVSKDLVNWDHLPIALAPDLPYDKDGCFSGSAIEKDGKLYLVYTGNSFIEINKEQKKRTQCICIAISDDGINFHKYNGNPVISTEHIPAESSKTDFRDPKVFKRRDKYCMIIGSNDGHNQGQLLLYESTDMLSWHYKGIMAKGDEFTGDNWECPDYFELDGRDILIVSCENKDESQKNTSAIYMVGKFDYEKCTFESNESHLVDYGFDFYAPQTFLDSKNRRIIMGWMHSWETLTPTQSEGHNWAGALTFPREVKLESNSLVFKPVDEIINFRQNEYVIENMLIDREYCLATNGDCYELEVVFDIGKATEVGIKLRTGEIEETKLSYTAIDNIFCFSRRKSGAGPGGEKIIKIQPINNQIHIRALVDKCSVEVFINNGKYVMSGLIFPKEDSTGIKVYSKGESFIKHLKKWDIITKNPISMIPI
ncbi:MAG: glycoside hydrolase family 32 protein [Clostridiaceae bacterium]|nr:glycoside hydrolase family 32 protein [Clostridiaceae bacterium]